MSTRRPQRRTNRRQRGSSDHLLDVRIRSSTMRRQRRERVNAWVGRIVFLVVVLGGGAFGLHALAEKFFFNNADYTLRRIVLDLDHVLTREEALAETGITEGMNIFSVDLTKVERALAAIPQIQTVRVERTLPDQIAVRLTARRPVAWVAADSSVTDASASPDSLLVDASGFLMRPRRVLPEYYHLPVIYGVRAETLQAGEPLHAADLRLALDLIERVAKRPDSLLKIRTVDISRGWCMEVVNDQNARITIGSNDLTSQLDRLDLLLEHCLESGRTLETVNLMVKRNTPVTFVVASVPEVEEKPVKPRSTPTRRN